MAESRVSPAEYWSQLVPGCGTIWDMTPSERRPRIPVDLAVKIDALRDDVPFETYIRNVLERHADHGLNRPGSAAAYEKARDAQRRHTYEDPEGAVVYVDKPTKGGKHDKDDVQGLLVVSDDAYGDAVGAYLTEPGLRGLRDVCTELLGEYES